tara:strand:+ start:763 stop:1122 length:360 start_codon:yes stop_codon:yes gene_type:complete
MRVVLYHATFNVYLPDILRNGLGGVEHKNWEMSTGDVCLAVDPYDAAAYCEVADEEDLVTDDVYYSGITVLAVDVTDIDHLLVPDPNLRVDEMEENPAWVYDGIIPPDKLEIYMEINDY